MKTSVRTRFCFVAAAGLACSHRGMSTSGARDAEARLEDGETQSSQPQAGPWNEQAGAVAAGANALYSWRYDEDGRAQYTVALHAGAQKQACASYSAPKGGASDYWYMFLHFGDAVAGTYYVGGIGAADEKGTALEATLVHRYPGTFGAQYRPVAGAVTIVVAPTFVDARAGASLSLTGWLGWSSLPRTTIGCSGSYPVDGGGAAGTSSCLCEDPSGAQSTCETTVPYGDCCVNPIGGGLVRVDIPVTDAKPCEGIGETE